MIDRKKLFDGVKAQLFKGKFTEGQVEGIDSIIDAWESDPTLTDTRQLAYIFATAYHETATTMQPIEEYGKGRGHKYGMKLKSNGQPYTSPDKIYYGRGHVQLTWFENYERFGKLLNKDLLNYPELALKMDISIAIMFLGMKKGLFTGVGLSKYFTKEGADFENARKIINGLDKAALIAGYARAFLKYL